MSQTLPRAGTASSLERAAMRAASARFGGAGDPRVKYRKNPVYWLEHKMKQHGWSKQQEVMNSVRDHRRTVVRACHGVGKSFISANIALWWIDVHPPGTAKVVTTAPTFQQVRAILWQEINRGHKRADLMGRVNQTEWWIGEEQVAFGRKPADHDESAFQGIHARRLLVIIDESDGVKKQLYTDANSLASNDDSRMLAIGNPDGGMATHMAQIERPDSGWNLIEISAFDSPNFTGEEVPYELRKVLTSHTYVNEMEQDFGVDSPVYRSKVLGQRTEDDQYGVIPWSWLMRVYLEKALWVATSSRDDVGLGVDVGASEHRDYTSIRERRGQQAGRMWTERTWELDQQIEMLDRAVEEAGAKTITVDANGVGFGLASAAKSRYARHKIKVNKYMAGAAAKDPKRYHNARAEQWWLFREGCRDKVWDLGAVFADGSPVVTDQVLNQLRDPRWEYDQTRRIKIERKEETIERIGRSPDDADALLMAFIEPQAKTLELLGAA